MMETTASFGYWVRRQRKALDLTQRVLAQRVGCALETIKKIERDERRPSQQMAELLAEQLMISPAERPLFLQCALGQRSPMGLALPQQPPTEAWLLLKNQSCFPVQSMPVIGRETELAQITAHLADPACHLLTLVGPGGIGKTRLAFQAAEEQANSFAHGVHFVALAALHKASLLAVTLLETFHLPQQAQVTPEEQLCIYLHNKQLLLVLDNFEQLQEGVGLLKQLLDGAKGLKLLVTSRERLKLHDEWLLPIEGLKTPVDALATLATVESFGAVRLFIQCARRLAPAFALTGENAPAVVRICQLVEGMPLAIELAAAWIRVISCEEIACVITHDLDLLSTVWTDIPVRHRSIRAVFEHAWRLLSAQEQRVLCQLAVFHQGFRSEAAIAVTDAMLPMLSDLVDKSWLRAGAGRFTMHELVRQFTASQLGLQGEQEVEEVQARHSRYYGAFLLKRESALRSRQQLAVLHEIEAEIENVRTGWRWAVEHSQVSLIGEYLKSLQWVAAVRGWNQSMREAFAQAARQLQAQLTKPVDAQSVNQVKLVLARALHCQAQCSIFLGLLAEAQHLCEESLAYLLTTPTDATRPTLSAYIKLTLGLAFYDQGNYQECERICQEAWTGFQASHDVVGCGESLWLLGLNCCGQVDKAERLLAQSLAIATHIGDHWGKGWALGMLCSVLIIKGDYTQAEQYAQESYQIRQAFEHRLGIAYSLMNLGALAMIKQHYARARQHYEEALTIGEEIGDAHVRGACLRELGTITHRSADARLAHRFFIESLLVFQTAGRQVDVGLTLSGLGEVMGALGDYPAARRFFRQALQILQAGNATLELLQALVALSALLIQTNENEDATRLLVFVQRHPTASKETQTNAERLLAELQSRWPVDSFAAAYAAGEVMMLETAVLHALTKTTADSCGSGFMQQELNSTVSSNPQAPTPARGQNHADCA